MDQQDTITELSMQVYEIRRTEAKLHEINYAIGEVTKYAHINDPEHTTEQLNGLTIARDEVAQTLHELKQKYNRTLNLLTPFII
jgi:hypothetical protein